jgi:3'(2'), 5'-bisphosphate nucleotidase
MPLIGEISRVVLKDVRSLWRCLFSFLSEPRPLFIPLGMWTIDPIDGTKGFLRGGQYAVCVSLIVEGDVKVGVIGCPNLPVDPDDPEGKRGCLFAAVKGRGTQQLTLSGSNPTPLHLPSSVTPSSLRLLESYEPSHSSHSVNSIVSSLLSINNPPIRMDSQAKYGCLARSEGGDAIYLRLPTGSGYKEKIWVRLSPYLSSRF